MPEISVYFGVTIDELFDITDEKHLTRIQNMVMLQETIDDNDLEYAQNFLLSQLAQQKNEEYCMQLLPALYNRKADEYRKKAEYYAKEALARFPDNHNNHSNLNEAHQGLIGDWNLDNQAERILYYKEFIKQKPDSDESLRWYIGSLLRAGRCNEAEEAIDCYKHSMAVQPKPRYTDAPMAIAQICEIIGDPARAIEAWKLYINVLNEDWNTSEGVCIDRANKKIRELENMCD